MMEQLSRVDFMKHVAAGSRGHSMFVEDMRRFLDAFDTARAARATICNFYIPALSQSELIQVGSLSTERKCSYIRIEKRALETDTGEKKFWVIRVDF